MSLRCLWQLAADHLGYYYFPIDDATIRPPTLTERSRLGYPNHGDGPYLYVSKTPVATEASDWMRGGHAFHLVLGDTYWHQVPSGWWFRACAAQIEGGWIVGYGQSWYGPNGSMELHRFLDVDGVRFIYDIGYAGAEWQPSDGFTPSYRLGTIRYDSRPLITGVEYEYPNEPSEVTKLLEYNGLITEVGDPEIAQLALPIGMRQAFATAYQKAVEAIPQVTTNSWANVLSTLDMVKDLVQGVFHPVSGFRELAKDIRKLKNDADMIKKLENFWLQYRYVFNTTKADILEYASVTQSISSLIAGPTLHTEGKVVQEASTYIVSAEWKTSDVLPSNELEWLQYYGFNISLINAWDMIPFSFVVDWFLNIGDVLDWLQAQGNALKWQPTSVWFILKSHEPNYTGYLRVPGYVPRDLSFYDPGKTGITTIFKRVVDGVCLFGP